MSQTYPTYPSLRAFYDADQDRLRSPEVDYGVQWRRPGSYHPWRVSYVRYTGEIYAVEQDAVNDGHGGYSYGPVIVLGWAPPNATDDHDVASVYYVTLDGILAGWPEHCGKPDGMAWLQQRLAEYASTGNCRRKNG